MSTTRSRRFVAQFLVGSAIATAVALGCGGGGDTVGPGHQPKPTIGITVIAGANATDTIGATLTQALTVEVRDSSGALAPNTIVRFTSLPAKVVNNTSVMGVQVAPLDQNTFSTFAAPTTDATGRASVLVQLGSVAGQVKLVAAAPTLAIADTVQFTVMPGAAASLVSAVADTGIIVGHAVSLGIAVVDRAGNPRTDPVNFDPPSAPSVATVSTSGIVTGVTVGHTTISAHVGTSSVTTSVEVVPDGTIAVYDGSKNELSTVNLDGSGYHVIGKPAGWDANGLSWMSSGNLLYSAASRMYTMTPAGLTAPLDATIAAGSDQEWPEYNAAAHATFYTSVVSGGYNWRLWKRADDGTTTEVMAEPVGVLEWRSTASPDGTKLAYISTTGNGAIIKVYDMVAGTTSAWSVQGQVPRWSPAGNLIAFVPARGGPLYVMNPDGSNVRTLTTRTYPESRVDWSPDGGWIIAKSDAGSLDLVSPTNGTILSLPYLARFSSPAWKR